MITISGLTPRQVQIADLLWNCETPQDVDAMIRGMPAEFRRDAVVMREMIVATVLDQVEDTQLAQRVIRDLG